MAAMRVHAPVRTAARPRPADPAGAPGPDPKTGTVRTRLLRVMTRLNVGGPARQAIFLTRDLQERGFDTRLVWGSSGPREGVIEPPPGTPASSMPWLARPLSPTQDLRAYRDLSAMIRRWRPRVVHTHLAKAGALGRLAAQRAHVPVVVHTFHGHVLQEYFSTLKNSAFAAAERALAARTDALVAVAPWVRDELLAMGIGTEDMWHVVPVGVDLEPLLRSRVSAKTARTRLGLPLDGPIVGCVGRLVAIKDHETFFESAVRVAQAVPDATFVLAGDGELRERLQSLARALLGDRVKFLGWVDDLPTLYGAFDVVALTSRLEGTPVALIEASASGTPVVATNVGGVSDVVRDGNTGLLVPPRDPVAVAANVVTLLQDPEGARRMGEEGARWVQGRFSDRRLADDLSGLYRELLARKEMIGR
jgi:glycosyltransferase involved in cell wall biosynthesis